MPSNIRWDLIQGFKG